MCIRDRKYGAIPRKVANKQENKTISRLPIRSLIKPAKGAASMLNKAGSAYINWTKTSTWGMETKCICIFGRIGVMVTVGNIEAVMIAAVAPTKSGLVDLTSEFII